MMRIAYAALAICTGSQALAGECQSFVTTSIAIERLIARNDGALGIANDPTKPLVIFPATAFVRSHVYDDQAVVQGMTKAYIILTGRTRKDYPSSVYLVAFRDGLSQIFLIEADGSVCDWATVDSQELANIWNSRET